MRRPQTDDDEDTPRRLLKFSAGAAVVLFIFGCLLQNWGSFQGLQIFTSYPQWGAWFVEYVAFAECTTMAMYPLDVEELERPFEFGFGALALSYLAFGLSKQFFMSNESVFSALMLVHMIVAGLGGFAISYCATLAAKLAGHLRLVPASPRLLQIVFGGTALVYCIVVIAISQTHGSPMMAVSIVVLKKALTSIWLTLVGIFADEFRWGAAVFCTFALGFVVQEAQPSPWKTSDIWNTQALADTISLLYFAAMFGLLVSLVHRKMQFAQAIAADVTYKVSEGIAASKPKRADRCCNDCTGRWN